MIFFDSLKHVLAHSLADLCAERGDEIVDVSARGGLAAAFAVRGVPKAVVITPPLFCEATDLQVALGDRQAAVQYGANLQADAMAFLSDCRSATLGMMPAKRGQVVFLGVDDVSARLAGLPETPIANQLRISALKSLAKEYGRTGINYIAVISQGAREMVDPDIWREKRGALKVYTTRYSPPGIDEYVRFYAQVLDGAVPANGGVLCLGKGVVEMLP